MITKLKEHIVKHKEVYIASGICFFAGFTIAIMRGKRAELQRGSDGLIVTTHPFNFLTNRSTNILIVNQKEGRGHPGYLIRCLEDNSVYPSQEQAAEAMKVYPSVISGHLKGKIADVHGFHFERLGFN